jgi:hypothetical protein
MSKFGPTDSKALQAMLALIKKKGDRVSNHPGTTFQATEQQEAEWNEMIKDLYSATFKFTGLLISRYPEELDKFIASLEEKDSD